MWRRLQALQEQGRLILAGPFPAVDALDPAALRAFPAGLIVGGIRLTARCARLGASRTLMWLAASYGAGYGQALQEDTPRMNRLEQNTGSAGRVAARASRTH